MVGTSSVPGSVTRSVVPVTNGVSIIGSVAAPASSISVVLVVVDFGSSPMLVVVDDAMVVVVVV